MGSKLPKTGVHHLQGQARPIFGHITESCVTREGATYFKSKLKCHRECGGKERALKKCYINKTTNCLLHERMNEGIHLAFTWT